MIMGISRASLRFSGAAAALALSTALFYAAPARANIVFDFSGVCEFGCSGTATGVLTLADSYTFGADITAADFISFNYSSSSFSLDFTSADAPFFRGGLNADGSFNAESLLGIQSSSGEIPYFMAAVSAVSPLSLWGSTSADNKSDGGSSFTFALAGGAVPEPSIWTMMLIGFAGLGFASYRAQRKSAPAAS
jgi:hypothetical protein